MAIVLLHLSDIHVNGPSDPILSLASQIAATVHSQEVVIDDVCILVTGDIAFSGLKTQYDLAEKFLKEIQEKIEHEIKKRPQVITVPGNHDCDFENEDPIRQMIVDSLTGPNPPKVSDKMIDECTAVQVEYFFLEDKFPILGQNSGDKLWRTSVIQLGGASVAFERLNLSWLSKIREQPGNIYFPVERYNERTNPLVTARVVLMHHPLNWISQAAQRPLRQLVRTLGDFVLTGHEHHVSTGMIEDSETEISYYVEGGVLQSEKKDTRDSSFSVLSLDLESSEFRSIAYGWNGTHFAKGDDGPWTKFRTITLKGKPSFLITREFAETLDDPGPFFGPAEGRKVKLEDLFVYPTILKKGQGETRISASDFTNLPSLKDGVLIEGEEKTGRTSLLHRLYRVYLDWGIVPILIRGPEIRNEKASSLEALISDAVASQYGNEKIEEFKQLPKSGKLLLVDNLDDCRFKNTEKIASSLDYLMAKFDYAVITVGGLFEVRALLDQSPSSCVNMMKQYRMDEFGYVLRGKLVDRWIIATSDGALTPTERLARRDHIEKTMNHTMVRKIVPSVPIYILVLLNSIQEKHGSDLQDSALGHYYESLISDSLRKAGVPPDKLTEHFQYCSQLAWFFHEKSSPEISENDIREFNERFSKIWHTVDFEKRVSTLTRANVLRRHGDDFEFRYPYIFYYFKGMYLSDRISDIAARAEIARCCDHLYVRDYANTILFLAHHTNDEYVLRTISEKLTGLFSNRLPIKFEGDTKGIEDLVRSAPSLIYSGEDPEETRDAVNKQRDERAVRGDGLAEAPESSSTSLSLSAQLVTLSKTIEILGQILKTQYSKIERKRKQELVTEIFNGPLRALSDFVEFMTTHSSVLASMIESAIQEEDRELAGDRRKRFAESVTATLVLGVTAGLLMRAADAVNAQSLVEDVDGACKANSTIAFRLIELMVSLDSQKVIPRQRTRSLYKDTVDDPFASRLLQWMVLYRLYMFRTDERDMQWLANELKLDLKLQHKIAYAQSTSTRRIE